MTENSSIATIPAPATSIQPRPSAEIQKFEFQQRSAKLFAMSGLFADIKGQSTEQSIAQAFVKISLGDAMGFNPAESMTGIDLIQGRVSVGANLRAARMQRAGYSWDLLQLDDKGCRLRLKFKNQPLVCEYIDSETGEVSEVPVVVSFMVEDAVRSGLLGKDNYKKNPRNMFFARAITNAQRWYAPGVLGVDILSTEEAIDMEPEPRDTGESFNLARKSSARLSEVKARYSRGQEQEESGRPTPAAAPPDPDPFLENPLTPLQVEQRRQELARQAHMLRQDGAGQQEASAVDPAESAGGAVAGTARPYVPPPQETTGQSMLGMEDAIRYGEADEVGPAYTAMAEPDAAEDAPALPEPSQPLVSPEVDFNWSSQRRGKMRK